MIWTSTRTLICVLTSSLMTAPSVVVAMGDPAPPPEAAAARTSSSSLPQASGFWTNPPGWLSAIAWAILFVQIINKVFASGFFRCLHDRYGHDALLVLPAGLVLLYHGYCKVSGWKRCGRRPHLGRVSCISQQVGSSNTSIVLDSGSFCHATGNRQLLDQGSLVQRQLGIITVGDGSMLEVAGHGSIIRDGITLARVLYVPGLAVNVVSVCQLAALDYHVEFIGGEFFVRELCTGALIGRGRLAGGMYQVDSLLVPLNRGRCTDCQLIGHIYNE
ncbi:hypothetical protein ACP70R_008633 [Stipagrostis hirtigluma subsp. patula]